MGRFTKLRYKLTEPDTDNDAVGIIIIVIAAFVFERPFIFSFLVT